MPTIKIITQTKILQYDLVNGKKQYIKSGPNKNKIKMKIRRPEKTKKILDTQRILKLFKTANHIVIERQNPRPGNSAGSSFTTGVNYGKLLACIELSEREYTIVLPRVWKNDLKLSMDKLDSIKLAEKLTSKSFRTNRGRLLHDEAESFLIGYWHLHKRT